METCPTVKIKSEPSEANPAGFVIINESDFNAEVHTLFVEGEAAPTPAPAGDDGVIKPPFAKAKK